MNKFLVNLILAVFCFLQLVHSQSECPQGWTMYRNEKCYFLQTSYLSFNAAQSVCATRGGSLASVKEEAQQTFLSNYLFNESSVQDEVWLGATRISQTEFEWEDRAPLEYSNWGPESPSDNEGRSCVAMQSQNSKTNGIEGSWRDVPCTRPIYFVCESELVWSPEEVRRVLLETRRSLENLVQLHETRYRDLAAKHEHLIKNPVPIGFLYYEHHGQSSPGALWPEVQWTDVSPIYAGLFFRSIGGGSEGFGSVQNAHAPTLTQVGRSLGQTPRYTDVTISPGTWSPWLDMGGVSTGQYTNVMRFYLTAGEIRPRNAAIRIWKRIG